MSVMVKEAPIHRPPKCHHERLQLQQGVDGDEAEKLCDGREVLFCRGGERIRADGCLTPDVL